MWRDLVARLFTDARFTAPCTSLELESAERQLWVKIPEELRAFYLGAPCFAS